MLHRVAHSMQVSQDSNDTKRSLIPVLADPRVWIVLLLLIRTFPFNQPPLGEHAWRQTLTLGVARNYLEWDADFFRPRTLLCDSRSGILAQEFPLFNYLIFLGWKFFGQENWVFRIIGLIANAFGLFWLFRIAESLFHRRAAILAMVIMGFSVTFSYSVRAMPDVFSLSLTLGGVWYGWQFLKQQDSYQLHGALFVILASLGMLCKIPSAAVLMLLVIPFLSKDVPRRRKDLFIILSVIAVAPVVYWYFIWLPRTLEIYGHALYYPRTLFEGMQEILREANSSFARFERLALQSRILFYVSMLGLTLLIIRRHFSVISAWALYSMVFFIFMVKAGSVFPAHEYYVIPYVPILALFGGYAVDRFLPSKPWILPAALLIIAGISMFRQLDIYSIPEKERKYLRLEGLCNRYIPADAKVLTSGEDGNPMMLYFCHRKGWSDDSSWKDPAWLQVEATVGLEYLIVERHRHDTSIPFPLVYEDEDFIIYRTSQ